MSAKNPRRHQHLSREAIARAALDIVDRQGTDALTLRRVAESLGVGVMSLYTYVDGRQGLVQDMVALLLAEIDMPDDRETPWEEAMIAIGRSLRAMALRHPHAFIFVALARYDEPSVVRYARRVERTLVRHGFPEHLLPRLATVLDAHATGFLLLEAQVASDAATRTQDPFEGDSGTSALLLSRTDPQQAFEDGMRTIMDGFKLRYGLPDGSVGPHPAK